MVAVDFVAQGESAVSGEPGQGAFDFPAVSTEAFAGVDSTAGDAGRDCALTQPGAMFGRVVGLIGAELGRPAASGAAAGADRGNANDHGDEGLAVVQVRTGHADDKRDAFGVGQDVNLSSRSWPGPRGPGRSEIPLFRSDARSVENGRGPVQIPAAAEAVQHGPVQLLPQPSLRPGSEPSVHGRDRDPERRRQIPPRTPRGQDEHDRGEHRPVIGRRRPTALRSRLETRDQRFHDLPQRIRHQPQRQRIVHPNTMTHPNTMSHQSHQSQQTRRPPNPT